jgi:hypothetical protein
MRTAVARGYFVDGVQLVNVGGEFCDSCEVRPAIGRSVSMHLLCARCAGLHAQIAEEYIAEVEASRARRAGEIERVRAIRLPDADAPAMLGLHRKGRPKRPEIRFKCGHSTEPENVYTNRRGWHSCRQCKRDAQREARRKTTDDSRLPGFSNPGTVSERRHA